MVEELNPLAQTLKKNPKISLVAFLKMDDLTDRWSIIISGNGLVKIEDRKKLFGEVIKVLNSNLETVEKHNIARIGIFPLNDHLIKDLLAHPENDEIKNEKANGNFIHAGHVLVNKPAETNLKLV